MAKAKQDTATNGNDTDPELSKALHRHFEDEQMEELGYLTKWPPWRIASAKVFANMYFNSLFCSLVMYNLFVVVAETDLRSKHNEKVTESWIVISNYIFLVVYTLELAVRAGTFGEYFLRNKSNVMDLVIISFDLISVPMSWIFGDVFSLSFLRVFRLARIGRSSRIIKHSPELAMLLKGLVSTAKSISIGAFVLLIMLTVSSVIAVEFIHPVNLDVARLTDKYDGCDRCVRAYESVMQANLTFFQQLIAGDSWGAVTIPVIEQNPLTAVYFIGVQITISIGLMNLLLAVIVDRANAARNDDVKALLKEEQEEKKKLKKHLLQVCEQMDTDHGGSLTVEELQDGFRNIEEFQTCMQGMDIGEEDLQAVFAILDSDGSGSVMYDEFVDQLWKMKSTDQKTMLIFIRYYVTQTLTNLKQQMGKTEEALSLQYVRIKELMETNLVKEEQELKELEKIEEVCEHIEGKVNPGGEDVFTIGAQPASAQQDNLSRDSTGATQFANWKDLELLRKSIEESASMMKQCLSEIQRLPKIPSARQGCELNLQGQAGDADMAWSPWCAPRKTPLPPQQLPRGGSARNPPQPPPPRVPYR